ncbi:MAG: c-type cytochrome [Phycisphaerae bacterium]|nr:c-type cytochrome [Saprospiraceae bacterium]
MKSKKFLPIIAFCIVNSSAIYGQAVLLTADAKAKAGSFSDTITPLFLIAAAALIVIALLVIVHTNSFLTNRLLRLEAEKNGVILVEEAAAGPLPVEEDFFEKLRKKYWENPVPVALEGAITLDHDYDGIRELDNHLPPWWVNLFILTVIWSIGYMWYYHWSGNGPNQLEEYKQEVESAKKEMAIALAGKANAVDESNVIALTDSGALGEGELIFKNACAACHGQKGEGTVGPNFTDEQWIHGGGMKNVFKTIKYGVPDKGMISWSAQLKPIDIQKVASYILTLKGTNPPNPKAPQGEIWKEAATDSTTLIVK